MCLNYGHFDIKGQAVVIERAPEPDDLLWHNSDIPRCTIIRNKIFSYFVSVSILVLGGAIQYFLEIQKNNITDRSLLTFYNILSSLSISVFNFILA